MIWSSLLTVLMSFAVEHLNEQCLAGTAEVPARCQQHYQYQPTEVLAFVDQHQQRQTFLVTRVVDKQQQVQRADLQFLLHCGDQCQQRQVDDYFASLQQAIVQQRLLQPSNCRASKCPDVAVASDEWLDGALFEHLKQADKPDALLSWLGDNAEPTSVLLAYDEKQIRLCRLDDRGKCVWFSGELRREPSQLVGQLQMSQVDRKRLYAPLATLISHLVEESTTNSSVQVDLPLCMDTEACTIDFQFRWDPVTAKQ